MFKKLMSFLSFFTRKEVLNEEEYNPPVNDLFSKISYIVFLLLIFILPLVFIPLPNAHFLFVKQIVFASAVLLVFLVWLLRRLKDGTFEHPSNIIICSSLAVVLVTFVSAIFSVNVGNSLVGQGYELGAFGAIFVGFLTVFLIPLFFNNKSRIFSAYLALLISSIIVVLFEVLRFIFGSSFLSFGIFNDATANTIGKWNDLAIFFGFVVVLSLSTLEFFSVSRFIKIISIVTLAVSLLFLALVNFSAVWLVVCLFSVVLFVYLFSFIRAKKLGSLSEKNLSEEDEKKKIFPIFTFATVVISIIFILFGSHINNSISSVLKISHLEVRPSWQATFSVIKDTFSEDPIFGSGPNRFVPQWLKYKDSAVNGTMFWNTDFSYGVGLIPTYFVTSGILGVLAWLFFLVSFLFVGFKSVFSSFSDKTSKYLVISSFFGALFLWIFSVIYVPSNVIVALTFIMTGIFVASLADEGFLKIRRGFYTSDSRKSFVAVLILIIILIATVSLEYSLIKRFFAFSSFQKGIIEINTTGNLDTAEQKILKAVSFYKDDLFYRALTEIGIIRMKTLISTKTTDEASVQLARSKFQNILGDTLSYANEAISIDNTNYENFIEKGRVYETLVPSNIEVAYKASTLAYKEAKNNNPHDPSILLMLARLEVINGNNKNALAYVAESLKEKQNYVDAIFLLSQIQISDGNIKAAISSVEAASILSPNDPAVFFQLGFLRFNDKNYKGAVDAFLQAINLNPIYANAKYFLGLSYEKLGKDKEAIQQFTDLSKTNGDSKEVISILKNLKAGRSPFYNASDSKPEKRATLPVKEKIVKDEVLLEE